MNRTAHLGLCYQRSLNLFFIYITDNPHRVFWGAGLRGPNQWDPRSNPSQCDQNKYKDHYRRCRRQDKINQPHLKSTIHYWSLKAAINLGRDSSFQQSFWVQTQSWDVRIWHCLVGAAPCCIFQMVPGAVGSWQPPLLWARLRNCWVHSAGCGLFPRKGKAVLWFAFGGGRLRGERGECWDVYVCHAELCNLPSGLEMVPHTFSSCTHQELVQSSCDIDSESLLTIQTYRKLSNYSLHLPKTLRIHTSF